MVQVTEGELAFLARQREVLGISYERHVAILLDVGCSAAQFDRMVEFGAAPTAAAHSDGAEPKKPTRGEVEPKREWCGHRKARDTMSYGILRRVG